MTETLKELVTRRLSELDLSLHAAWQSLECGATGKRPISYEMLRRVMVNNHTNISDRSADSIAEMLRVPVNEVLEAAGERPRLGRFELPTRADRLTKREREVVIAVVDAILNSGSI